MKRIALKCIGWHGFVVLLIAICILAPSSLRAEDARKPLPDHVPPKRSSQIHDGFGINSDLPREPYLPWNRWWWTRTFDAGFKWIRIGQYENSSDRTSWDWIEQNRGVLSSSQELEDAVDSLVDNGVKIQVQLLYGNPIYTAAAGKLPDKITPEPGSFHNADRSLYSVFWPPKTPQQIAAFNRYVNWMVEHFRDRIHHWALWNEQDITYWNPTANPEDYGALLKSFVQVVHEADRDAKGIYGGQADPSRDFTKRALDKCQCASGIDVYAYHTYPGYGQNLNPEAMDYGAYLTESPALLRELVRNYSGIRPDIEFFDDEFNSIPSWKGCDESVQAKYVPRGLVYNLAAGVKTFVWLLAAGTDGNEYDDFGLIHGTTYQSTDFTPRPVFFALQNTNAVFSDTKFDPTIEVNAPDLPALRRQTGFPFMKYGFRSRSGKAIVAYWLAAHSLPGNVFPPLYVDLSLKNTGIAHPVLVDITSGEIKPVEWKKGTTDTLQSLPLKDSVMVVTDESYFDWPVLPEAPSSLSLALDGNSARLKWELHEEAEGTVIERRIEKVPGSESQWKRIAKLGKTDTEYTDPGMTRGTSAAYRVRAYNNAGESAYSNIVHLSVPGK
ncbi:MAG TPA: fibronectin type III domain-containing protein [Terriglobales bacterium]|nr:fibronectin type III domain-containing protein [Terriglobales bacterium]